MTPQTEAKEIYNLFYGIPLYVKTVKECCNILIDKILEELHASNLTERYNHYLDVQKEIEKL